MNASWLPDRKLHASVAALRACADDRDGNGRNGDGEEDWWLCAHIRNLISASREYRDQGARRMDALMIPR